MSELVDHASEAEQQIKDLIEPLRQRDAELDREILARRVEIDHLRAVQTRVRALIRLSDLEYQKRSYATNGKKEGGQKIGTTVVWPIDHTRADRLAEWVAEHAQELNAANDGEGFYADWLERQKSLRSSLPTGLTGSSALNKALVILHDRGVIRLVRVGYGRSNRTKLYKVVV